jgi:dihydroneopterin aldolase
MGEFTIELKGLQFFSFHGLYEEEKKKGGEFRVDLSVKISEQKHITGIDQTINYENLFTIIKTEMNQPRELLETLTQMIAEKIYTRFPSVKEIDLRIEKINPPIPNFNGKVAVSYRAVF